MQRKPLAKVNLNFAPTSNAELSAAIDDYYCTVNASLVEYIADLNKRIRETKANIARIKAKCVQVEAELVQTRAEREQIRAEREQIRAERERIRAEREQDQKEIKRLEAELAELLTQSNAEGRQVTQPLDTLLHKLDQDIKTKPSLAEKHLDDLFALVARYKELRKQLSKEVKDCIILCNQAIESMNNQLCINARAKKTIVVQIVGELATIQEKLSKDPKHPFTAQLNEIADYIAQHQRPSATINGEHWDLLVNTFPSMKNYIERSTPRKVQLNAEIQHITNDLQASKQEVRPMLEAIRNLPGAATPIMPKTDNRIRTIVR